MNYLASPPLVVAYALAGTMDIDLVNEPLGHDSDGNDVYLSDIWPTTQEVAARPSRRPCSPTCSAPATARSSTATSAGTALEVPTGDRFAWDDDSTYMRQPPYFDGLPPEPDPLTDIERRAVLAKLGDSVTTDHISPAGRDQARRARRARYLDEHGVEQADFNSYGSRRGNHEVMMRGTFANIRLRNQLAPGGNRRAASTITDGEEMSIYDAAMRYIDEGTPLVVLAGKEYGSGSSRDWAAKGTSLLGVRAVIAESFERIHRSNLVGMGVLPLQFADGETAESLGLTGEERVHDHRHRRAAQRRRAARATVTVTRPATCSSRPRPDRHAQGGSYYRHGGILQYVLRQLAALS